MKKPLTTQQEANMANDKKTLVDRIPVCPHGTLDKMSGELVVRLQNMEGAIGQALFYNSGYRCTECNKKEGGVKNSAHLRGAAVDIRCKTSGERFALIKTALEHGFKRIGIGKRIIHLDVDGSLPQKVAWLY